MQKSNKKHIENILIEKIDSKSNNSNTPDKEIQKKIAPEFWMRIISMAVDATFVLFAASLLEFVLGWSEKDNIFGTVGTVLLSSMTYHIVMELSPLRGTIGKYLTKTIVVRTDGEYMNFFNVFFRSFFRILNWCPPLIFMIPVFLNKGRMGAHDALTNTMTVNKKSLIQVSQTEFLNQKYGIRNKWVLRTLRFLSALIITMTGMTLFFIMKGSNSVRDSITEGYIASKPSMKYIEENFNATGNFPENLKGSPAGEKINHPNLIDSKYTPGKGAIYLNFKENLGVKGGLIILPLLTKNGKDQVEIQWICKGTGTVIYSLLPKDCMGYNKFKVKNFTENPNMRNLLNLQSK